MIAEFIFTLADSKNIFTKVLWKVLQYFSYSVLQKTLQHFVSENIAIANEMLFTSIATG